MRIFWSAEAKRSLRSIHRFIAQDSVFYADRMAARIIERVEYVAHHPSIGHAVHEYPERALKEVHEKPYRIVYEYDHEELWIVTIVHFRDRMDARRLTSR
jgi:plasmid stabilization system protein ParE